jgi:lysyl-tRNA synthetase class 2
MDDLRSARERKLEELASLGLPYLPNTYGPTRSAEEVKRAYEALEGASVRVAGRLMSVRLMGKAAFAHIQDASGRLQLYFKLDILGDTKFAYFKLLDLGDIVGAEGTVFRTRTGEVSIQVHDFVLLSKAYLPLPEKFHGLADVEMRYRQRYLDLISNEDTRLVFQRRSSIVTAIRRYLDDRGFLEVETPILQPLYGGAAANPFVTHYDVLRADVYLRIATELYLKRLLVGGFDRVYEMGKDFRNEGFSRKHSPEFSMLELYQAYADYHDIMALSEDMIATVGHHVLGSCRITYGGEEIDLTPPWRRMTISEALRQFGGIDLDEHPDAESLLEEMRRRNIQVDPSSSRGELIEELVTELVEPRLIHPTFLCDYPIDFPGSLLAKRRRDNPELAERFEAYLGGLEIGNGFTELNDPADQRQRMEAAVSQDGSGHLQVDRDFLTALEYGMPPAGGVGLGIDRIAMILTDSHHIRETILFPLLRTREGHHAEP